jgi:predicted transcriptional regulator
MRAALPVLKALSNDVRIRILEALYRDGDKNLNDIANLMNLSNSAISLHMSKLEEAGLVEIRASPGKRGSMKLCKPTDDAILVELNAREFLGKCYTHEISVGQYTAYSVEPTCGLATLHSLIGEYDDPRYYSFPERFDAAIIWLTNGYVEYALPNSLKAGECLTELSVAVELSSEAPGVRDDYPSDIYFYLNQVPLGCWISPGDFGKRRGRFNPSWWPSDKNQYGLLKELTVNREGTFIDGNAKISSVTIADLAITHNSSLILRIEAPMNTRNPGGMTVFGKGFGDYNQGVVVKMLYD